MPLKEVEEGGKTKVAIEGLWSQWGPTWDHETHLG